MLKEIVEHKKIKIAADQQKYSVNHLQQFPFFLRDCLSLKKNLQQSTGLGAICEFKRASPSQGIINQQADLLKVVNDYRKQGAAGVSILTEDKFFAGNHDDIKAVRESGFDLPVLNKDFIIDPYQVTQAKAYGADVILLIAALLTKDQASELCGYAQELGLEVLIEFHDAAEIKGLDLKQFDLLGVNNRNLKNLKINTNTALELASLLDPEQNVLIAESGYDSSSDFNSVRQAGYQGILVGTSLMKSGTADILIKNLS